MPEVVQSATFSKWLSKLADRQAVARILMRIDRLAMGNPGDVKPVGSGISEMRIDYGPGYRLYFLDQDGRVVVLLCGGDKRTQDGDIKRAIEIAADWVKPVTPAPLPAKDQKPSESRNGSSRKKRKTRKKD